MGALFVRSSLKIIFKRFIKKVNLYAQFLTVGCEWVQLDKLETKQVSKQRCSELKQEKKLMSISSFKKKRITSDFEDAKRILFYSLL